MVRERLADRDDADADYVPVIESENEEEVSVVDDAPVAAKKGVNRKRARPRRPEKQTDRFEIQPGSFQTFTSWVHLGSRKLSGIWLRGYIEELQRAAKCKASHGLQLL
jgi:hypothetical protein